VYINSPVLSCARRARVLLVAVVFGLVLATQAAAYGGSENFCGSTLLGKAQICTSAVGKSTEYIFNIAGENTTNGNAVCVGPVTWNGKEYSAPYGYSCGGADYDWEFTPIASVAAAVENPNGVTEKIAGLFDWKEYPPVATTESASGVSSSQGTLNGTLNPERSQAHYYFEYGKTTSYGSSTGEQSAGSGTSNEKESATISGLEEGTTYHYRLVVKNAVSTTDGGDQSFTTLSKPGASTNAASSVMEEQTTLNGTVNPKGSSTKYYFQYGETTSYGKTTSEGSAGSGTSGVAENATVSELQPGLTYHYRIVASSAGGTVYGGDQSLKTLTAKAAIVESGGVRHVYYRGLNGQLHEWAWNGTEWTQHKWGFENEVASNPSAVVHSNGTIDVYYRNTKGQIGQWWYGKNYTSEWTQKNWGTENEVIGSPSAVALPSGATYVYYHSAKGQIGMWWYGENYTSEWSQKNWGVENEVASSPSAIVHSNSIVEVYYRDTKGQIGMWWYGKNYSTEWTQKNWGVESEVTDDPSAVALPNGDSDVFYRDTKGQIGMWWYGTSYSTEWHQSNWGVENEVAGDPSADAHSNNNVYVYYRSNGGQLGQWWYGVSYLTEWTQKNWGATKTLGGDPSAAAVASGGDAIYYGAIANTKMWQWAVGSSGTLTEVGAW